MLVWFDKQCKNNNSICRNDISRGDNMNPINNLPTGFGFALLQNEKALQRFNGKTKAQQKEIMERSSSVNSKQEMKSFIDGI